MESKTPMYELLETMKENKDIDFIIEIIESHYLKYEREEIVRAFEFGWDCGFAKSLNAENTGDEYFDKIYYNNENDKL